MPSPTCLCSREDQTKKKKKKKKNSTEMSSTPDVSGNMANHKPVEDLLYGCWQNLEKNIHYQKMDLPFVQTNAKKK